MAELIFSNKRDFRLLACAGGLKSLFWFAKTWTEVYLIFLFACNIDKYPKYGEAEPI